VFASFNGTISPDNTTHAFDYYISEGLYTKSTFSLIVNHLLGDFNASLVLVII